MGIEVTVDRDVCLGSGLCVMYAPHAFAQDEQAKSFVHDVSASGLEDIRTAVEACPTGALSLTITEGE